MPDLQQNNEDTSKSNESQKGQHTSNTTSTSLDSQETLPNVQVQRGLPVATVTSCTSQMQTESTHAQPTLEILTEPRIDQGSLTSVTISPNITLSVAEVFPRVPGPLLSAANTRHSRSLANPNDNSCQSQSSSNAPKKSEDLFKYEKLQADQHISNRTIACLNSQETSRVNPIFQDLPNDQMQGTITSGNTQMQSTNDQASQECVVTISPSIMPILAGVLPKDFGPSLPTKVVGDSRYMINPNEHPYPSQTSSNISSTTTSCTFSIQTEKKPAPLSLNIPTGTREHPVPITSVAICPSITSSFTGVLPRDPGPLAPTTEAENSTHLTNVNDHQTSPVFPNTRNTSCISSKQMETSNAQTSAVAPTETEVHSFNKDSLPGLAISSSIIPSLAGVLSRVPGPVLSTTNAEEARDFANRTDNACRSQVSSTTLSCASSMKSETANTQSPTFTPTEKDVHAFGSDSLATPLSRTPTTIANMCFANPNSNTCRSQIPSNFSSTSTSNTTPMQVETTPSPVPPTEPEVHSDNRDSLPISITTNRAGAFPGVPTTNAEDTSRLIDANDETSSTADVHLLARDSLPSLAISSSIVPSLAAVCPRIPKTLLSTTNIRDTTHLMNPNDNPCRIQSTDYTSSMGEETGTGVRRDSLTGLAISSSITPSLAGVCTRIPETLLPSYNAVVPPYSTHPNNGSSRNHTSSNPSSTITATCTSPVRKEASNAHRPSLTILTGTGGNSVRRSSLTDLAICSSITPSLAGAFPRIPEPWSPTSSVENSTHLRSPIDSTPSETTSNLSSIMNLTVDAVVDDTFHSRRKRMSLLRLHIPEHPNWISGSNHHIAHHHQENYHGHHHGHHHTFGSHLPHIHVPTLTFTAPASDGTGRKFSFGIRRHSHTTLHRTDSMVSLCYRSLVNFISEDNLQGLQNFLENKRVQVDNRDENGSTALIHAASKGKLHFVRELVNHGADVDAEDGDNWTALLCAAKEGHKDICLELLEHGADLEHRDMGGWSPLMWATYKGKSETVSLLLSRGADVNAHGNYHISSLLWAAGRGYPDIAKDLIAHGAKVNVGDKYGTTALVWACRKGNVEIVDSLLKAGANVDTAGMYSWTALLVATLGNHVDVVSLLLEHKPNVNASDKDGCTALAIACREGHHEIANALLNAGAYINIQDRTGDTNLIHAVKGGHRGVVESLLKKYADVDIGGKDKKTATYIAVEKGNIPIVKLLLNANPDLEISTKDGDTPLLRAVRSRNAEIVQLLLDKKAKVSATDKKGDTVLHIAMRARSKAIVEVLLRNPKNSQLLYRPNRQGETPYNIDVNHPKTILGQIFGARRLNTNEDNENMLGYDLYSSALADILSEPSLSTPITVGLYAKWGSGKSFLLNKLREEMKNFARQWIDPVFQFSSILFLVVVHVSLLLGVTLGLSVQCWIIGLASGLSLVFVVYLFLVLVWFANKRYDWYWLYNFNVALTRKLNSLKLLLQVMFCHPPTGAQVNDTLAAQPIKFYFTDQTRVGTTAAGENAVVQMVGSLYDSIENDYGSLATRLYRAFRPKAQKTTSSWRWSHLCCLPYIVIFELCFWSFLVGVSVLTMYLIDVNNTTPTIDHFTSHIILGTVGLVLGVSIIANLYTWSKILQALVFSQRRQLQRSISKLETLKSEGFIQTLRSEVSLMTEMVKCLDSFTSQQTRLAVVVDGLDSCEQDKVLLVLDAIQALFSDNGYPFIVILAIDPHVIAKAVEVNSRRLFSESNIGGHDYLRNMVHLPFYLQNSGLRKVKVAQQTAQHNKKPTWIDAEDSVNYATGSTIHTSVSNRRLSTESSVLNSNEKLKPPSRKGSRKLRLSESIASSIGSNLNRLGGAHDLNKMLLTDDYFSDVNPRSMRRLMNVVYVTGRLLKAFQIDFNWYHLASWINITEQWPFRTSWMILHYDLYEETLDDSTSLKILYDKVRPQIPVIKDAQPLLEIDRDERKLDVFLTFHRSSLLISDMKIFLPFTINLDPYIKKKIKEEQQTLDEDSHTGHYKPMAPWNTRANAENGTQNKSVLSRHSRLSRGNSFQEAEQPVWPVHPPLGWSHSPWIGMPPMEPAPRPMSAVTMLPSEMLDIKLSSLSTIGVCDLLGKIEDMSATHVTVYKNLIRDNNISGRVLLHCDLQELKKVLKMGFGDWELFRMLIVALRETELSSFSTHEEGPRSVRFTVGSEQISRKEHTSQSNSTRLPSHVEKEKSISRTDGPARRDPSKQSIMEKQVTLEEQMICGALQTLNEEACEDVLDVPSPAVPPTDSLAGSRPRSLSTTAPDTDYVLLQASPLLHWQPVLGEPETSDDSSQGSTSHLHRSSSQRSIASQRSTCSQGPRSHNKPDKIRSRPASLLISPPPSPRPAHRSKSTDENSCTGNNIPLKATLATSLRLQRSDSTQSDELTISVPVPATSLEKLTKLKDRFIATVPSSPAGGESDDESTPLVSELSTPTHSHSDGFRHSFSPTDSTAVSPASIKSLPRGGERFIDIDYPDDLSLVMRETPERRPLSRQNAEDWENPETSV